MVIGSVTDGYNPQEEQFGNTRRILEQLKKEARSCGGRIVLTVNRYNANSIAVYRHLGFHCIREEKTPIGGGYFMDDYIMALDCGQRE